MGNWGQRTLPLESVNLSHNYWTLYFSLLYVLQSDFLIDVNVLGCV